MSIRVNTELRDLKQAIHNMGPPSIQDQLITLNNHKHMFRNATLRDYGLRTGDRIDVVPRGGLRGGSETPQETPPDDIEDPNPQTQASQEAMLNMRTSADETEEKTMGVRGEWEQMTEQPEFGKWFKENYHPGQYYGIEVSRATGGIRTISLSVGNAGQGQAVVRYFTISHVWTSLVENVARADEHWSRVTEEPTPPRALHLMVSIFPSHPAKERRLSIIMQIHQALQQGSKLGDPIHMGGITTKQDGEGTTMAYKGGRMLQKGKCPLCEGNHSAGWSS